MKMGETTIFDFFCLNKINCIALNQPQGVSLLNFSVIILSKCVNYSINVIMNNNYRNRHCYLKYELISDWYVLVTVAMNVHKHIS